MEGDLSFDEILSQIDSLKKLLEKVEKHKNEVKEDVYLRVKKDYQERIAVWQSKLQGMTTDVQGKIEEINMKQNMLKNEYNGIEEKLEELNLRNMVGELDESSYQIQQSEFQSSKEEITKKITELQNMKNSLSRVIEEAVSKPEIEIPASQTEQDILHPPPLFDGIGSEEEEESVPPPENAEEEDSLIPSFADSSEEPSEEFDDTFDSVFQPPEQEKTSESSEVNLDVEPKTEGTKIKCSKCGAENQPDAWYCENCGAPLFP